MTSSFFLYLFFFSEGQCLLLDAQFAKYTLYNNYCRNFLEYSNSCRINVIEIYSVVFLCLQSVRNIFTTPKNVSKSAQIRIETRVDRLLNVGKSDCLLKCSSKLSDITELF